MRSFLGRLRPLFSFSQELNQNGGPGQAPVSYLNQILKMTAQEEPSLDLSKIRQLDLGHNFFRHITPRKKKTMLQILDAYLENLNESERTDFSKALSIYYDNNYMNKDMSKMQGDELDLPEEILWHLYSLMLIDRISGNYARFEYLEHFSIIDHLNQRKKDQRNKVKYVFTSHPTQPNSLIQLIAVTRMLKGIEENDFKYLKFAAKLLLTGNKLRLFNKTSYLEESQIYHSEYLPHMIEAIAMAYELGFKDPEDYFEIPGTWLTFDFDNHPGMELGIMTYTHGLTIELTTTQYLIIIKEAQLEHNEQFAQIIQLIQSTVEYSKRLREVSDKLRIHKEISHEEFFQQIPIFNLFKIEDQMRIILDDIIRTNKNQDSKNYFTALKLSKLFKIFRLTGVHGQIRLAGEDVMEESSIKPLIHSVLKEISLLNTNGIAGDMIIIANFVTQKQYDIMKNLLAKYHIQNMEIVPLLETFSSSNTTDSRITMIASSDTRQRDGLLLTELRNMREHQRHPNKYIYMGQGITPERGGGPYQLIHTKYKALTRAQRKLHIRTIQGHYFTSEFASRDLAFTFLLAGLDNINTGDDFEPTHEYMDFLFELDNYVGVPQRQMQASSNYNDLYVKNNPVKTMVESFNFAGSREMSKPLEKVKNQRAIVQAYINSDRCSFTHPELAYWDRVPEELVQQIAQFYYQNNPHIKYILYMYALMLRRCNLDFAKQEVGLDANNPTFKAIETGKASLVRILDHLGLGTNSTPLEQIWKQHLGCHLAANEKEVRQKEQVFYTLNRLQLYQTKKILKDTVLEQDSLESRKKLRILQSTLANITSYAGKG